MMKQKIPNLFYLIANLKKPLESEKAFNVLNKLSELNYIIISVGHQEYI
jgi:hypothetical protein